ncbi:MAG TPA: hypothetical protein VMV86_01135 [Methanosarcinales archaeon]|nr:hypothetical protein [Methanosarcinales archaeon]
MNKIAREIVRIALALDDNLLMANAKKYISKAKAAILYSQKQDKDINNIDIKKLYPIGYNDKLGLFRFVFDCDVDVWKRVKSGPSDYDWDLIPMGSVGVAYITVDGRVKNSFVRKYSQSAKGWTKENKRDGLYNDVFEEL